MGEIARIKRNPAAVKIAEAILKEYEPESVEDMQGALKDIFGPMFEAMLKGELNNHQGYESNSKEPKETTNRRNGSALLSSDIFLYSFQFLFKCIFRFSSH